MRCEICGRALRGGIEALEGTHPSGQPVVRLISDPDRNWIECEGCGRLICSDCCGHADTSLCDDCLAQSERFEELQFVENCSLPELEEFLEGKRKGVINEPGTVHKG